MYSICIAGLFARSYGIVSYAKHLICHLASLPNPPRITVYVHKGAASHFRSVPDSCKVIVCPLRNFVVRQVYWHFIFPWSLGREFDLIHCIANSGLLLSSLRQVVTIHDTYERVSPERFGLSKRILLRYLVSSSGKKAKRIIAVSRNTAIDIKKYYAHLSSKTEVIYNGVPCTAPPYSREVEDHERPFLFVGTLEPGKDLECVLRAFSEYRRGGKRSLHVVGAEGWGQSHLPTLIEKLDLRRSVHFLGYLSDRDLATKYCTSLALIFASTYEGFGLPVVEAMWHGCPVIAARNSGIIEAGGKAALFFKTHDEHDLAGKMSLLESDKELQERMKRDGHTHAQEFDWKRAADATMRVYQQVIASN